MELGIIVDFFLADTAQVANGKLYALGMGWDSIHSTQFPTIYSSMAVCLLIHVPYQSTGIDNTITIELQDADGKPSPLAVFPNAEGGLHQVLNYQSKLRIERNAAMEVGDFTTVPLAIQLNAVPLNAPGSYSWVVSVNDEPVKRVPIKMVHIES